MFDLEQYDDDFVDAAVMENDIEEPPDGKYDVVVESVEFAKSKISGKPMLKWVLRIIGPDHIGWHFYRNNMLSTKDNMRWLKTDLSVCGMNVDGMKLSELPNRLSELLDVALSVHKKTHGEFTNVYFRKRIENTQSQSNDLPF